MTLSPLSSGSITLNGAPDTYIGTDGTKSKAVQVMQLELTQTIVDELLQSARGGRSPQILFGRVPTLKYGGKSHVLETTPQPFRAELYRSNDSDSSNEMVFGGLVSHTLAIRRAEEVTAGADTALETLKNNLASIHQEREARKTELSDVAETSSTKKRFGKQLKKPSFLSPLSRPGPNTPSPLLSPAKAPGPTSAPATAIPPSQATMLALRKPAVHLLAARALSLAEFQKTTRASHEDCEAILGKLAVKRADGKWTLGPKGFKELNVWSWPYPTQEERQAAIDNAIKAYDKQRIDKHDSIWQKLLPAEERGKGKILSRLNLNVQPQASEPKSGTPALTAKKLLTKKGPAKKATDSRKSDNEKAEKTQEKKTTKREDEPRARKAAANGKRSEPHGTNAPGQKETRAPSMRETQAPISSGRTPVSSRPKNREPRPSERMPSSSMKRALNNQPKNPSPLSASPPVNASDFENDHPVHKVLSASASPAKSSSQNSDRSLKRKANGLDNDTYKQDVPVSQSKIDYSHATPPTSASSSAKQFSTPSTNGSIKRKVAGDAEQGKPKQRKLNPIDTTASRDRQNGNTSPQSDSSTSPTVLSWSQITELAKRFKKYYETYAKLHHQLTSSPDPPTEKQRSELMKMHTKLAEMKREIELGAIRR